MYKEWKLMFGEIGQFEIKQVCKKTDRKISCQSNRKIKNYKEE